MWSLPIGVALLHYFDTRRRNKPSSQQFTSQSHRVGENVKDQTVTNKSAAYLNNVAFLALLKESHHKDIQKAGFASVHGILG